MAPPGRPNQRQVQMSSKLANIAGLSKLGPLLMPIRHIVKKPATLSYGLEELPPAVVTTVGAVQHVGVSAIFMIYPLIIAREVDLPADQLTNLLQLGLLVLAIAALLQALPRGPIGSRCWRRRSSPGSIWRLRCWRRRPAVCPWCGA